MNKSPLYEVFTTYEFNAAHELVRWLPTLYDAGFSMEVSYDADEECVAVYMDRPPTAGEVVTIEPACIGFVDGFMTGWAEHRERAMDREK